MPNAVYTTQYRKQMYPYKQPTHSSNSSQSEYDNIMAGQPAPHNLYNINTNRTSRYDSNDDILKSPETDGEGYDSFEQHSSGAGRPSLAKHSSLEGAVYKQDPVPEVYGVSGYSSLERNTSRTSQVVEDELNELTPSRFGSKRESHSDYRDSHYQIVDMPPPPSHLQYPGEFPPPPKEAYSRGYGGEEGGGDSGHKEYGISSTSGGGSGNIPYIDSSQSSLTSSASSVPPYPYTGRYDGGAGQQPQQPPPPQPQQQQHQQSPYDSTGYPSSPQGTYSDSTPSPGSVSVTKYQNYVEVSKPFEMADVYKYSERRRRQRVSDQGPSSPGSRGQSPYMPRATHFNTQQQPSRSRPGSPGGHTPEGGYLPHVASSPAFPGAPRGSYPAYSPQPHTNTAYSGPAAQPSPRHVAYQAPHPAQHEDGTPQSANHTPHR